MRLLSLFVVLSALVLGVSQCQATPVTFAQFTVQSGQFTETYSGSSNSLLASSIQVFFQWVVPGPGPEIPATLTLNTTTTTPATLTAGILIQQAGYAGTFTITENDNNANLLSGTFQLLDTLTGVSGGNSVSLSDSTQSGHPSEVVFSSNVQTGLLLAGGNQAFAFSMSGLNPNLGLNGSSFVIPFSASGTGTFSADLAAPEPMPFLLLGAGLAGLGLLRRKLK
jgi:hypothetical protein